MLAIALVAVALGGACSTEEPKPSTAKVTPTTEKSTPQDRAACARLQRVVTALADKRSADALLAVDAMQSYARAASDDRLREAGVRFFDVILEPVPNENDMTLGESLKLGQLTREEGAAALSTMIDACDRLGQDIRNLPTTTTEG